MYFEHNLIDKLDIAPQLYNFFYFVMTKYYNISFEMV